MLLQFFTVLLPLALHVTAEASRTQQSILEPAPDSCASGVHIIAIRDTEEDPGYGFLQDIVDGVIARIPGSNGEAIDYPAKGLDFTGDGIVPDFDEYEASETKGLDAFEVALRSYNFRCYEKGMGYVFLGYGQGAQIIGDLLCGRSSLNFGWRKPIIRAIIQLGDPTNTRGLAWHQGNSTHNGLYPRPLLKDCEQFAPVWQSYCDADDMWCDRGSDALDVHLGYVERNNKTIVDFVVDRVKKSQEASDDL